jgi:hypothetical protein
VPISNLVIAAASDYQILADRGCICKAPVLSWYRVLMLRGATVEHSSAVSLRSLLFPEPSSRSRRPVGSNGSEPSPDVEAARRENLEPAFTGATPAAKPKKTGIGGTDTGKEAGGRPATGRLCQAGLEK